jgi:hypothetical protein
MKLSETVICAAIHYDDGEDYVHQPVNIKSGYVICGHGHHNCLYIRHILTGNEGENAKKGMTQEFLTSKNRFLDRKEAFKLASSYMNVEGRNGCLYSEDLY